MSAGALAGLAMLAARLMADGPYANTPVLEWWVNQVTGNHWATIASTNPKRSDWIDRHGRVVELISANLKRRKDDYSKVDIMDIRWEVRSTSNLASEGRDAADAVKRFGLHPAYDPGSL